MVFVITEIDAGCLKNAPIIRLAGTTSSGASLLDLRAFLILPCPLKLQRKVDRGVTGR